MQVGDIVRFKCSMWNSMLTKESACHAEQWEIGLLIEYNTWEKIARILWKGKIISVRAENTQLAIRQSVNT